jgi:hypothetical protein
VRDLRRTAFSSRCRPIASSPRRRLVDWELSPKPVSFDGLGRVPAREQIVHCLIPTGERKPRVGQREMKFAAMKFACFLSRQQTLCRVIAVASRIVHGALHSPRSVSARSHLRWWLDSGRMRSLIDGVCIKLLTQLRHNQSSARNPKSESSITVRPCRVLKGPPASKACTTATRRKLVSTIIQTPLSPRAYVPAIAVECPKFHFQVSLIRTVPALGVLAGFRSHWPDLNFAVAGFDFRRTDRSA